jgi:hypothetical protein
VRPTYPYGKLYFYEHILQVPVYIIFDPHSLQDNQYKLQIPDANGRFWIPELNLFLGIWHGLRLGSTIHWLRWWDGTGNLLLWSSEKAEQEQQRADQERQRAKQERQRAEQEKPRAEAAEQEIARLRALLKQREQP